MKRDGAGRCRTAAELVKIDALATLTEDERDTVADMLAAKVCRSCNRPIGGHTEEDLAFCVSFYR